MALTLTIDMINEIDNEVSYNNDGTITIGHHVWFEYLNYKITMDCWIENSRLTSWRAHLGNEDTYEELSNLFVATIEAKINNPWAVFSPIAEQYYDEEEDNYTIYNYDNVPIIINSYLMGRP